MPGWVIDYVLLHELAHLLEAGHTQAFWRMVDRFPKAERARGFLEGVALAAKWEMSAGVHEPQRCCWLSTQRTVSGRASPSRYRWESVPARRASAESEGLLRRSDFSSRATMVATHSFSSALVIRAGRSTTTVPSSFR